MSGMPPHFDKPGMACGDAIGSLLWETKQMGAPVMKYTKHVAGSCGLNALFYVRTKCTHIHGSSPRHRIVCVCLCCGTGTLWNLYHRTQEQYDDEELFHHIMFVSLYVRTALLI
jgi:hypothetical protein